MPILSVIIPTHERPVYATKTVQALLSSLPDTVEIVVSDSSVSDRISASLRDHLNDPRLTFVRPGRSMSIVEHFNFALSHATGDYLCFIGDDDFVLPDLVDIAFWAKKNCVDAVKLAPVMVYYWPDFQHKSRGEHYSGTLHISAFSSRVTKIDAVGAMTNAIRQLGTGVGNMPRAYAGLVSRALTQKIIEQYGALFGGVSPDIYSSALISAVAQNVYAIDYPAIVPGASQASAAGQSASGGHVGKLRENDHIGAFQNLDWDPLIPEFYSVPTVWSYSLMKAADVAPHHFKDGGYGRLYVKCLIWHKNYSSETLAAIGAFRKTYGTFRLTMELMRGAVNESGWIASRLWQKARERVTPARVTIIRNVPDSDAGIHASLGYITDNTRLKLRQAFKTI